MRYPKSTYLGGAPMLEKTTEDYPLPVSPTLARKSALSETVRFLCTGSKLVNLPFCVCW